MRVRERHGTAAELHALELPEGDRAELWVLRPTATAVAMGSAQRPEHFDQGGLAASGIELAPRRSGGGAVFIEPAGVVWIDVLLPRSSVAWSGDLAAAFMAVGECWARALADLGIDGEVVASAPERSASARLACWAGLGWGEITVDGAKIVGLSQRRTRWGARVQSMAVIDGSADRVVDWIEGPDGLDDAARQALRVAIGRRVLPVDRAGLEQAAVAQLRTLAD